MTIRHAERRTMRSSSLLFRSDRRSVAHVAARATTILLLTVATTSRVAASFAAQLSPGAFSRLSTMAESASSVGDDEKGRSVVVDSHLHVWGRPSDEVRYPFSQTPPASLVDRSDPESLLSLMDEAGVDGCLVVQPINYGFDHSYVRDAIAAHPDRLKGMMLYDPNAPLEESIARLDELRAAGFVGVRFNPYLFPSDSALRMSRDSPNDAPAFLRRCAELGVPVGVMCFKGLGLHLDDVAALMDAVPDADVVLDHFGFTKCDDGDGDGDALFARLLELCRERPRLFVKISALFRIADDPAVVRERRFVPLLEAVGADRLLFGTDFPFVVDDASPENYRATVDAVRSWTADDAAARAAVLGGTAERLFGEWGTTTTTTR